MLSREEEETQEPEITLSTTSLLGLFLGLVLVCGVFFGFGYSVGHRATAAVDSSPANSANNSATEDGDGQGTPKAATADSQDSGSAGTPASSGDVSSTDAGETASPAAPAAGTTRTVTLPVVQAPPPSSRTAERPPRTAAASVSESDVAGSLPGGSPTMVQVAAVAHQEDADVLVAALRNLGYSAVVRNGEPQDKLLHVQVGPFATRAEANAMRQKLAGNGYNAILK